MYYGLFLVSALLSYFPGESLVHSPSEMILAFAGEDVILPCSFNISGSDDFPTVEWSKEGLQPNVIFLYRDGCETYEMKNPSFQYRTSFITKELKNRNISLRISNVQLSDAGKYQCMRLWKNAPQDITTVELVVGAASDPKLSVISAESAGVSLQCEASCWLPEPEITFLDDRGHDIPAGDPKRRQHASGCYTVTRRVTLQDATSSVTCRVQQPQINQTRDTEILIPVGGQKWLLSKQTSHQSLNGAYDDQPFLQSIRVDGAGSVGNSSIEALTREVADLKSKLHEKEKIIWWLQSNNNNNPPEPDNLPQYQGLKPAASRQNSNPASGGPTRRNLRIHSSPAVLNLDNTALSRSPEANMSNRKLGSHLTRESSAWPGPDVQRRHSSLLPTNNRFSLLADLAEETAVDVMGTEHKAGRKAAKPSKQK
ncbi:immunoglobulin superfamily member 11-like [Chelmon rostratus]|uniref:immunoglobulin superfamily member 11-like n=1 Tax=Chelmon rostratus TaxID=109905 RepID=UPI001BEA2BE4|nr:immunoglobulin superfamily member 11-like [Chelmon rostratus]